MPRHPARRGQPLTPRQKEVAELIWQGLSNDEIGERLFCCRGSVRDRVGEIFVKLGCAGRPLGCGRVAVALWWERRLADRRVVEAVARERRDTHG